MSSKLGVLEERLELTHFNVGLGATSHIQYIHHEQNIFRGRLHVNALILLEIWRTHNITSIFHYFLANVYLHQLLDQFIYLWQLSHVNMYNFHMLTFCFFNPCIRDESNQLIGSSKGMS